MSTPQRITPECQPVFPCWLWSRTHEEWQRWMRNDAEELEEPYRYYAFTHWHPDQPTAPEPVKEGEEQREYHAYEVTPTHPTAEEIAREAAIQIHRLDYPTYMMPEEDGAKVAAIILTAARRIAALEAARMVRESGAVEALESYNWLAVTHPHLWQEKGLAALAKLRAITQQPG